jgi:hypothetical protein
VACERASVRVRVVRDHRSAHERAEGDGGGAHRDCGVDE